MHIMVLNKNRNPHQKCLFYLSYLLFKHSNVDIRICLQYQLGNNTSTTTSEYYSLNEGRIYCRTFVLGSISLSYTCLINWQLCK